MKVVIIVPTYNEKGNIERLIPILEEKIFPVIKNHKMHVLVVDDNSPDGTADEVKKLMKKWDNISLSIGEKRGLGAAYVRGMNYATTEMGAEVMFEMDA
ncbi:MAG: glycosyltransferase, partial [Candidatus Levybacteria bacterium]|nr:glycosyltransferase [Candidatus Levybacteria bacterium]